LVEPDEISCVDTGDDDRIFNASPAPDDVQYWELIRIVLSSNQRNHDILFGTPFASDLAEFETITGLQATTDCVGFRCRA
jgi:hypothetical protein